MDERRMDLRPLDPDEDPWRRERVVKGAMARIRALQRETAPEWREWLPWWRAAANVAVLVILVAGASLVSSPAGEDSHPPFPVAAAGVPAPVAEWMASDQLPAAEEVFAAMQGYP